MCTLWKGRFKSSVVETERYLLTVYRYIELNQVRAGMVAKQVNTRGLAFNIMGRVMS
jgi:putative transposase